MKQVQVLIIGIHLENFEDMCRVSKISYESYNQEGIVVEKLSQGEVIAPVAFIHLSLRMQKSGKAESSLIESAIKLLPETTRRVLVCNGIESPENAKNSAIQFGGDMIIDGLRVYKDSFEAYKEHKKSPFEVIVEMGCATEIEMVERWRTIELGSSCREGISAPRERKADERYHEYGDKYYRNKKE